MSEAEVKETEPEFELEVEEDGTSATEPAKVDEESTPSEEVDDSTETSDEQTEDNTEDNSEELSEYSLGVQKRITAITHKRREAERREQAALEYAEAMKKQLEELRSENKKNESSLVNEFGSRIESELESAKSQYREAHEEADPDKLFEAQQKISRLALEQSRHEEAKNRLEVQQEQPDPTPQPVAPNVPDAKAQAWAERNDWFGEDQSMTYAAMGIHQKLVQEGVDPSTDDYYARLDAQLQEDFPSKYPKTGGKKSKPPVAAATNSGSRTSAKGKRTIKLTESEKAIARKLNVPYEAYAKEVAKLNKDR